jgi:hypothetical protein
MPLVTILARGFEDEARISAFYNEKIKAFFLGFYLNAECAAELDLAKWNENLKIVLEKKSIQIKVLSER